MPYALFIMFYIVLFDLPLPSLKVLMFSHLCQASLKSRYTLSWEKRVDVRVKQWASGSTQNNVEQ